MPDDNVIVRLCTIECCFAHSLDDASCPENVSLMADLKAWGEICNRIYVWDYTTNYAHTLGIFPDFGVLQRNMQVFYENNVVGIYEEGNYYIEACDGEFGELRAYLLSKLMQNPYIDYSAYMNEFLAAYYGKGWQNIRDFIDMTVEKPAPEGEHLKIYHTMAQTLGFNSDDIKRADSLWEAAKSAAETEDQLRNIERSEICWRYWKGFESFDKEETDKLVADMKAMGIIKISEGGNLGPDDIRFANFKAENVGNKVLFPVAIVLYAVAVALTLAATVIALKNKPRKYIYILLLVLIGVFYELFGWHKRAFVSGVDVFGYTLTLVLIAALFAFGGALAVRGKRQRAVAAAACAGVWLAVYSVVIFLISGSLLYGTAGTLCMAVEYVLTGIEGIAVLAVMIKNLSKKSK